jgi:hypothetical protein
MRWGQKAKDATEYSNFPKKEVRNVGRTTHLADIHSCRWWVTNCFCDYLFYASIIFSKVLCYSLNSDDA